MVKPRLLLVLALVTGAVIGVFGGSAGSYASELDGQGLHCAATEFRHGIYTEGCAAVFVSPDNSYLVGETEATAYQVVDGQRVPAQKVLVRIAFSEIYVNGNVADTRGCACSPATYVQDATRNVSPGGLASGNTAQAAVTYEVWSIRGTTAGLVDTYTVMSDVVPTLNFTV